MDHNVVTLAALVALMFGLTESCSPAHGSEIGAAAPDPSRGRPADAPRQPIRRVVDLCRGEAADVVLANGEAVRVELLETDETISSPENATIAARARVKVGDQEAWIPSGNYHLPVTVGRVQIDCPVTKAYYRNSRGDPWRLEKDARLRIWPAGSAWFESGAFTYPARQRWFASNTQMADEPTFVDVSAELSPGRIYYHDQLDIGGAEGMTEVVAATDGMVIARGQQTRGDIADFDYSPTADEVLVLDDRGWVHIYTHLKEIGGGIAVGKPVSQGQRIGMLGKEGSSGGWSHLHYGIRARQPSGKWGTEAGYCYLWEAYNRAHNPHVLAVARPHHLVAPGASVVLDASRSWAEQGGLAYRWTFSDGSTAEGVRVTRRYDQPGIYSEILQVTDGAGHVDYDFANVQVFDTARGKMPPGIHAAYFPTLNLRPAMPITFLVRSFNAVEGEEAWDFGDGTPPVAVRSNPVKRDGRDAYVADGYAATVHRYAKPGHYLVRVHRVEKGAPAATARLHVEIAGQ
jgi:murein DD-endopeptidase MepM/ murein hydrolase activator NlpD